MKRAKQHFGWQLFLLLAIASLSIFFFRNLSENLQARGIASGFGFLNRPSGFDIAFSLFPFDESSSFLAAFGAGLSNTILVAGLSILGASFLGLVVALLRLAENPVLRLLGTVYVELTRNIPLLLQLFIWYFVVLRQLPRPRHSLQFGPIFLNIRGLYTPFPQAPESVLYFLGMLVLGLVVGHVLRSMALKKREERGRFPWWHILPFSLPLVFPLIFALLAAPYWKISRPELQGFNFEGGLQIIPEFLALIVALSFYTASFIGEIIRSGIQALPKGQYEAAASLGMTKFATMKHVILPQALRSIIPPLTSQYLNITKNTSLAAAIGFPDLVLVFAGTVLNITGQAIEIMAVTMMTYLIMSLLIASGMNWLQRRLFSLGATGSF